MMESTENREILTETIIWYLSDKEAELICSDGLEATSLAAAKAEPNTRTSLIDSLSDLVTVELMNLLQTAIRSLPLNVISHLQKKKTTHTKTNKQNNNKQISAVFRPKKTYI